ncbi:MAG TPA: response regulator [Planctomycetota bacterium]|nr:response regulator [Planctomycetota bacterium]
MNILLVDDDDDARTLTKDLLASAGHHVTAAASGFEAIMHVEIQHYDLVLLDLMMPGVDGFQFAEFMSCHWNTFDTPVIIVSCRKDAESKSLARVFDCAGYLEKPFSPAELFDVISGIEPRIARSDTPG